MTPKVGLSYRLDSDTLVYARVAKGYRIGGTNPAVGQFCYGGPGSALGSIGLSQVPPKYDADSVWSYEVGSKSSFLEGRALLDVSAYIIRWNNIQQNVPLTACGFQFTGQLGGGQSKGVDLQAEFELSQRAHRGRNFRVRRCVLQQDREAGARRVVDRSRGGPHCGSPWQLVLFGQGISALSPTRDMRASISNMPQDRRQIVPKGPLDGAIRALVSRAFPRRAGRSLRTGVKWGGYDLSLYVQNLFDTHPRLTVNQDVATPTGGTPLLYVISWRPRTIGVTLTFRR